MRNNKCLVATVAFLTAGAVAVFILNRKKHKKVSRVVADAGYELAHDIHFPLKINRRKKF